MAKFDHAHSFFGGSNRGISLRSMAADAPQQTQFTDSSGLFAFVFSDPALETDATVAARVREAAYYLKGFCTLVTNKLFSDNANDVRKAFAIPASDIKDIATNLPLLGNFVSEKVTNSKEADQLTFSTKFLEAAMGLIAGPGDAAMIGQTASWLSSIGDQIKISHDARAQTYNITMFSALIDIVGTGAVVDIEPKFRIAGTSLSVSSVQNAIANCISMQSFTLAFEADCFTAAVDINALQDPATKADLDSLVGGGFIDQIDKSKNYFGVKRSPQPSRS